MVRPAGARIRGPRRGRVCDCLQVLGRRRWNLRPAPPDPARERVRAPASPVAGLIGASPRLTGQPDDDAANIPLSSLVTSRLLSSRVAGALGGRASRSG